MERIIFGKNKYEIILVILFLLAFFTRIAIDDIYLENPGTVKASDPVYHVLVSEYIADTGIIGKHPDFMAQGYENTVDGVPPLLSIISGSAIALSGIQPWNVYYFFVVLFSAFNIILVYLIAEKLFKSKPVALVAAGLAVIPIGYFKWFYYLSIGIWPQNTIFTLLLLFIYVFLLYLEKKTDFLLLFMGIINGAVYLLHFSEILIIVPLNLYLIYKIMNSKNNLKEKFTKLVYLGGFGAVLLFFSFSTYIVGRDIPLGITFNSSPATEFFIINLGDIAWPYLIFMGLAVIQLGMNWKKYRNLLLYSIYYSMFLFVLPYFLVNPHYYALRPRQSFIFFVVILSAYGIYTVIKQLKIKEKQHLAALLVVVFIFGVLAIPGYFMTEQSYKYENVPLLKYSGHKWVAGNTPEDSVIYFFGLYNQGQDHFMKRVIYRVYIDRLGDTLAAHKDSSSLPLSYEGFWSGNWDWTHLQYVTGLFSAENYPQRPYPKSMLEADYVYFENFNEEITTFNRIMAQYLIDNHRFSVVYNDGFALVLRNG